MKKTTSPARSVSIVGIVFLLIGIGMLIAGVAVTATRVPESKRVYVPAKIVRIDTYRDSDGDKKYNVYISYEAEGHEFERKINFHSSTYYEGKVIEAYYEEGNPGKIHVKAADLTIQIVFFSIGVVTFWVAFKLLRSNRRGSRKLMESGTLIQTEYVRTQSGMMVNGMPTYYIVSSWKDFESGKEYSFRSAMLWQDPAAVFAEQGVRKIPVYIKPGKPQNYYVDLSGIPGLDADE